MDKKTLDAISKALQIILNRKLVTVSKTVTRPTNTTTYDANDVITSTTPAIITFDGMANSNGGGGTIIDAVLTSSGNETTKLDADLLLFDTTVTMDSDNAAFTPTDAEILTYVGVIKFLGSGVTSGTAGTGGSCAYPNALAGNNISYNCATGSKSLYGILVARNAYVPISGEVFGIRLKTILD